MPAHDTAKTPRWSEPGATGPGLPLNAAARRQARRHNAEFARWYDAQVAERYGGVQPLTRQRAPITPCP